MSATPFKIQQGNFLCFSHEEYMWVYAVKHEVFVCVGVFSGPPGFSRPRWKPTQFCTAPPASPYRLWSFLHNKHKTDTKASFFFLIKSTFLLNLLPFFSLKGQCTKLRFLFCIFVSEFLPWNEFSRSPTLYLMICAVGMGWGEGVAYAKILKTNKTILKKYIYIHVYTVY